MLIFSEKNNNYFPCAVIYKPVLPVSKITDVVISNKYLLKAKRRTILNFVITKHNNESRVITIIIHVYNLMYIIVYEMTIHVLEKVKNRFSNWGVFT